jgi:hypothetical protein
MTFVTLLAFIAQLVKPPQHRFEVVEKPHTIEHGVARLEGLFKLQPITIIVVQMESQTFIQVQFTVLFHERLEVGVQRCANDRSRSAEAQISQPLERMYLLKVHCFQVG